MKKKTVPIENRETIYMSARRLVLSVLAVLLVVYVFITLASAWFSRTRQDTAGGISLEAVGDSSSHFALYHWNTELARWDSVHSLSLNHSVPNQTDRYMVVINTPVNAVNLNLSAFTKPDDTESDELFDHIYIKTIQSESTSADPATYTVSAPLSKAVPEGSSLQPGSYTALSASDLITQNIRNQSYRYAITCSDAKTVVFDIHIGKEVCNYFELWGLEGSITLP